MEDMKKNMRKSSQNFYVQGNTVRKLDVAPKKQPERKPSVEEERRYRYHLAVETQRQREFSVGYVAGFVAAIGLSFAILGGYIQEEATLYKQTREIQLLQNTRDNLRDENNAVEARLEDNVDLSEIEKIAMEQYGMVYPSVEQILLFENTEGDYIRQYENIPD